MPHSSEVMSEFAGNYKLLERIGRGGMAEIYKARDLRHDRIVAVKLLDRDRLDQVDADRFLREVRIAARLSHPHILPVFDSGEASGRLYYVMPFVDGESLRDRIHPDGLPIRDALRVTREIADALDYAHSEGVVHRDVKPENILLSQGHALLADFGIARLIAGGTNLTAAGTAVGTPAYMSPEQLLGEEVGPPADIFALACVAYELLAGRPPFPRAVTSADIARRLIAPPPPLPSTNKVFPRDLESCIMRSLSAAPGERHGTALELARSLESAATDSHDAPRPAASLVVRPFDPVGGTDETAFLCEGLSDEVIADLASVGALRVISRTTSMHYKGTTKDARAIGNELGVRYVVNGSVQQAGKKVRVRAELVDTLLDSAVWSAKLDGTTDDPFAIQERVAQAIVEALRVAVTPEEQRKLEARPIPDPRAYEIYRLAHAEILRFSREGLDHARSLLDEALERVGDNALLFTSLGQVEWQYVNGGFDLDESRVAKAERWLTRALDLDANQPQALATLAWIAGSRGQMPEAIRLMLRSLDADQNDSTSITLLGLFAWITGKWELMRRMSDRIAMQDPLHLWGVFIRGLLAMHDGNYREADRLFESGVRMEPNTVLLRIVWAVSHLQAGSAERARAIAVEGPAPGENDTMERLLLGLRAALSGNARETRRLLSAESMGPVMDDAQWGWHIADVLATANLNTEALDVLSRAVAQGLSNVDMLERDDMCLRELRSDRRFATIVERARRASANLDRIAAH